MSKVEAILIILLVIGVIFSNLAVLRYSAKFKMPQYGKKDKPTGQRTNADNDDDAQDDKATDKSKDNAD